MSTSIRDGVLAIYSKVGERTIVGLTGRTGSGCSPVAAILLTRKFSELRADVEVGEDAEIRKKKLLLGFAAKNWEPFFSISFSTVLISFLLDQEEAAEEHLESLWGAKAQDRAKQASAQISAAVSKLSRQWSQHRILLGGSAISPEEAKGFIAFWEGPLQNFAKEIRQFLGADASRTLQAWGDNLRSSGVPYRDTFSSANLFTLPSRVIHVCKIYESSLVANRPCRVVIDAIRNPMEISFFRTQIAGFLTFGITTDDDDRRHRLQLSGYSSSAIDALDQKEYPQQEKVLSGEKPFVSQNIQACLEKADVFIRNNGRSARDESADLRHLSYQLVKYVCLSLYPGLVTPSRDERCMQLAFVARANSGCISRQVGAVVTDAAYSIKAVGWNDVAKGQTSCLLRSVDDLAGQRDQAAFSSYEFSNRDFRNHVGKSYSRSNQLSADGLSCPFCFKDEFNGLKKDKNQVHTRSLHAEENAFLQVAKGGSAGIEGGVLYSTASPCELCAKKAFQLGIKRVVYVDPYPGISNDHIFASGESSRRPAVELFSGAVGIAYHRLFDPLLPIKDERKARMQANSAPDIAKIDGLFDAQ